MYIYERSREVTYPYIIEVTEDSYEAVLDDLDEQLVNQSFFHSRAMNNIDAYLAMERAWNYTYQELCLNRDSYNITVDDICGIIQSSNDLGKPPNVFAQLFEENLRNGVFCGLSVSDHSKHLHVHVRLIQLMFSPCLCMYSIHVYTVEPVLVVT